MSGISASDLKWEIMSQRHYPLHSSRGTSTQPRLDSTLSEIEILTIRAIPE